jgi:hypothetical protein
MTATKPRTMTSARYPGWEITRVGRRFPSEQVKLATWRLVSAGPGT